MKNKILFIFGVILCLGLSGCSIFNQEKTLKCSARFLDENEDIEVIAKFKNNYLKKINVKTFINFNDEESANIYYNIYKDSTEKKVMKDGKNIIIEKEDNIDSNESIYSYKNYRDDLIKQGYICEK